MALVQITRSCTTSTMILCTGDMGFASLKPIHRSWAAASSNEFREISSVLKLRSPSSARAGIRFKPKAAERASFRAHAERLGPGCRAHLGRHHGNYQQADGSIVIPDVLRPYMGIDRIPPASTCSKYFLPSSLTSQNPYKPYVGADNNDLSSTNTYSQPTRFTLRKL